MAFQFTTFANSSPRSLSEDMPFSTFTSPFGTSPPFNASVTNLSVNYAESIESCWSSGEPRQTSPVQEKDEILEEIVRECEAIERRSSPSSLSSSPSNFWSSDDYDAGVDSPGPVRNPVRKERKKAQNRQAATRYREKKRKEKEEKMNVISDLLETNSKLKGQVDLVQREIEVLKKLMVELGISP